MSQLVQSIGALLAITNPLAAALVFLSLTSGAPSAGRRRMAFYEPYEGEKTVAARRCRR